MRALAVIILLMICVSSYGQSKINLNLEPSKNKAKEYTMPYVYLLPIAALTAYLSYDSFKDSFKLNNEIDKRMSMGIDASALKDKRALKYKIGGLAAITSLALFIIGFQRVEIKADNNRLTLSYRF